MKKLFFAFSILGLSISSFSQTNLDSLIGIWNDKTKVDIVRLEAMEIFLHGGPDREFRGNDLIKTNPDSMWILIDQMQTLAKGYPRYELLAVLNKGGYYQHQGVTHHQKEKLVVADSLYNRALAMAHAMNDNRLIILSTITVAFGQNALAFSSGRADSLMLVKAQKNFVEALNLIELTSFNTDEVTSTPDRELNKFTTNVQIGLGLGSMVQGNFPSAIAYFQEAMTRTEKIGPDYTFAAFFIGYIYYYQNDFSNARKYLEESLQANRVSDLDERAWQEGAMSMLTNMLEIERNFPAAIHSLAKFLKVAEKHEDKHWMAHILGSFGHLYLKIKDFPKAEDYFSRALAFMKEAGAQHEGDELGILIGLHYCYIELKDYNKAIKNDSIALLLTEGSTIYAPYARIGLTLLAEDYYEKGDYTRALQYAFQSIKKDKEDNELGPNPWIKADEISRIMSNNTLLIGKTYNKQGQFTKAIPWCEKANTDPDIELQKDACECLYESHKALKQGNKALAYHEQYLVLSDSIHKEEIGQNLQQMEFSKQVLADSLAQVEKDRLMEEARQEEIRQSTQTRNILIGSGMAVLLFSGGLWSRLRYIRKSKAVLQVEKDRSENLLLNILPAEIAEELKANGRAVARDFENVSILFTDFKEFTQTSAKLTAQELVGEINFCFEAFDNICTKYKVEKIKTIGDAYMAAGGLPVPTADAAKNTVLAALDMQRFIADRKAKQDALGKPAFEMRVGVHTGPVVAGIVGVKKFQYDIWGDTVNTASRMESNSEVGKVNISESTYEAIKEEATFVFEKREKIAVKGKGEMEMYFVSNEKIS